MLFSWFGDFFGFGMVVSASSFRDFVISLTCRRHGGAAIQMLQTEDDAKGHSVGFTAASESSAEAEYQ
jgi:hypothetical protein